MASVSDDKRLFFENAFSTTTLTNTPQDVGTASTPLRMGWASIVGGAAAEVVVFADSDANEVFSIGVPAGTNVHVDGFLFSNGLEVDTATAAGDVSIVVAYMDQ